MVVVAQAESFRVEILRAYEFYNARYWSGALPGVLICFHPQRANGRKLAHYCPGRWRNSDKRDEIVFTTDLCLSRGVAQVLQTLVHEMVHVWQQYQGKPGKNNFHNREWHAEAARVGLLTKGPLGMTRPGPEHLRSVVEFKPQSDAIPFRPRVRGQRGKLLKWVCGCGFGVRVAVDYFDATCNECGEDFRRAKKSG